MGAPSEWVVVRNDVEAWLVSDEAKVEKLLAKTFASLLPLVKSDALSDLESGVPVVVAALVGGVPAALSAAEAWLLPKLEAQGVTLEQTALTALANELVAKAQAVGDSAPESAAD